MRIPAHLLTTTAKTPLTESKPMLDAGDANKAYTFQEDINGDIWVHNPDDQQWVKANRYTSKVELW